MRITKSTGRISTDKIVLILVLLQVFAIQWLNLTYRYSIIIDIVIVILLGMRLKWVQKGGLFLPLIAFVVYSMYQAMIGGSHSAVYVNNMYYLGTSVLVLLGMSALYANPKKLEKMFIGMFPICNVYMLVNIPVLLMQLNDHFELSGRHLEQYTNNFKPDLISGLFGYNGTPLLGAFSAFFFIYCLWYYRKCIKKKNKAKFLVYYFVMLAFYLYISIPNDNKGFFIQIGISYVIYYLSIQNNYTRIKEKLRGAWRGVIIAFLGIAVFIYFYSSYKPFSDLVDLVLEKFLLGISSTNNVAGGAERFAIINYFFRSNINKLTGDGIGSMYWKEELGYGFLHFGQNDLGPFLLLGGIMLLIIILWLFYKSVNTINRSWFVSLVETIFLVIWMLYTQIFTTSSIMISYMLFVLVCGVERISATKENSANNGIIRRLS